MRVLVACEFSGIVRDAFIARGHDAVSCDLLPTESPGPHIQGDVLEVLNDGWDLMIAHPPCTHLCVSGAAWFYKKQKEQAESLVFVQALMDAPIEKWCIENPVGIISTRIRKPDQVIQPYDFGDPFQKTTHIWLKNLPKLIKSCHDAPLFGMQLDKGEFYEYVSGKGEKKRQPMWHVLNMFDKTGTRAKDRSKFFPGIANAMADQWGKL